ncbi:MAG TPA: histidine kinase dimerization/phospho-acceptor domain-containing protein, partial [Sporichthya sp.]|nr:histidine kinase dimerization/phospho-acceptor domain-containing protein [Sporichthya sp.]
MLRRLRMALPALTLLSIGLLLAAVFLSHGRAKARSDTDAAVRTDVAQSVTAVSAAIRTQVDEAARGTSASTTVAASGLSASGTPASGPAPDSLIRARDSGVPTLDDTADPASIVVPVYGTAQPPRTTQARRDAITGYRITPLVLGPVLADRATAGGGIVVHGPSRLVAGEPGPAPAGSRSFAVPLDLGGAAGWTLQGWHSTEGTPAGTWLAILALFAVFTALAVAAGLIQRSAAVSRARRDRLERDAAFVNGLAPVVQSSLDLGEVIPVVSSHLVHGLDLAGLSLSTQGETGERPLFSWGSVPDETVKPVPVATQLAAGQTYALGLARGGRLLGMLRVVAGAPLDELDLRSLGVASEFLGSTLANAEAFARQQAAVERMRSVDDLKNAFLATASHELRTPVTAIKGFSALILEQWDDGDSEMTRTFLERVLANARTLDSVTENLLDFARLERGVRPSVEQLLDLGATTGDVL